ncbi:MAG TPA: hypothetical protein VEC37_10165, partial [Bacillota bacterium]|nr:hypothetical protein [Bacillota bacterium]
QGNFVQVAAPYQLAIERGSFQDDNQWCKFQNTLLLEHQRFSGIWPNCSHAVIPAGELCSIGNTVSVGD